MCGHGRGLTRAAHGRRRLDAADTCTVPCPDLLLLAARPAWLRFLPRTPSVLPIDCSGCPALLPVCCLQRGLLDPEREDPFSLFVASTNIRYCYYADTHKILGSTYGMLVLQVGAVWVGELSVCRWSDGFPARKFLSCGCCYKPALGCPYLGHPLPQTSTCPAPGHRILRL
jgi:hypothetical protein